MVTMFTNPSSKRAQQRIQDIAALRKGRAPADSPAPEAELEANSPQPPELTPPAIDSREQFKSPEPQRATPENDATAADQSPTADPIWPWDAHIGPHAALQSPPPAPTPLPAEPAVPSPRWEQASALQPLALAAAARVQEDMEQLAMAQQQAYGPVSPLQQPPDQALVDFCILLQQTQQNLNDMLVDLETARLELDIANGARQDAEDKQRAVAAQLAAADQQLNAMQQSGAAAADRCAWGRHPHGSAVVRIGIVHDCCWCAGAGQSGHHLLVTCVCHWVMDPNNRGQQTDGALTRTPPPPPPPPRLLLPPQGDAAEATAVRADAAQHGAGGARAAGRAGAGHPPRGGRPRMPTTHLLAAPCPHMHTPCCSQAA
jgi:hypothetical protein